MKGSLSGRLVRNVRAVNGVLVYSSSAPQVGIPDDQTVHSMLFRFTATPPQRISALEKHDLYPKKGSQGQLYQAITCFLPFRNYKQLGILGVRVWLWSFMLRLHTFAFECLQKVVNTTVFGKGKPAGMSNPGYVWTKTVFKVLQARNKKEQTLQVVCDNSPHPSANAPNIKLQLSVKQRRQQTRGFHTPPKYDKHSLHGLLSPVS